MHSFLHMIAFVLFLAAFFAPACAMEPKPPQAVFADDDALPVGAVARLGTTRLQHAESILAASFSPDGRLIATGGTWGGDARLWDVASAKEVVRLGGHKKCVQSLAFSSNGRWLATSDKDSVFLWELGTYRLAAQFPAASVLLFSDGDSLLWGKREQFLCCWELPSCKERLRIPVQGQLRHLVKTSDGKALAGLSEFTVELDQSLVSWNELFAWDIKTGETRLHLKGETVKDPTFGEIVKDGPIALSRDGSLAVWHEFGKPYRIREVSGGKVLFEISPKSRSPRLEHPIFISNDHTVVLWEESAGFRAWNPAWESDRVLPFADAVWPAEAVASPDGKKIAGLLGPYVRLWDSESGKEIGSLDRHCGSVKLVRFSDDGKRLGTGSHDGMIKVWETGTWRPLLTIPQETKGSGAFAFMPDNKTLLYPVEKDGIRLVFQPMNGQGSPRELAVPDLTSPIVALSVSPNGKEVLVTDLYGHARFIEVSSGKIVGSYSSEADMPTLWVAFSPDGKTAASTGGILEKDIFLWETKTHQLLHRIKPGGWHISNCAFSPNSRLLAAPAPMLGDNTSGLRLWEVASGKFKKEILLGKDNDVHTLAYSPDGKLLAGGGQRGEVRLWQADSGTMARTLQENYSTVLCLDFSPDGKWLAAAYQNSTALIWKIK